MESGEYITFTHRIIYSDMPKSRARSLPAYCPRMRVLLFRTMQREAVLRACGKRGVLCTVYVSSGPPDYEINYSSVWITLDAVLGVWLHVNEYESYSISLTFW